LQIILQVSTQKRTMAMGIREGIRGGKEKKPINKGKRSKGKLLSNRRITRSS